MSTPAKPPAPKRPLNATFSYKQEKFDDYAKANPGKKLPEITKDLCSQYSALPAAEKKKYEDAYKANMLKYTKEKEEYEAKHGKIEGKKKKKSAEKKDKSADKPKKKEKSTDKKKPAKSADKPKKAK